MARANPIAVIGNTSPDSETFPPIIELCSPENGSLYNVNSITFSLSVSIGESNSACSRVIKEVYYEADWIQDKKVLKENSTDWQDFVSFTLNRNSSDLAFNLNVTEIPDGEHNVTLFATEVGAYHPPLMQRFTIVGSSIVYFTIDTTSPCLLVLPPTNGTYEADGLPFSYVINEPSSWVGYSLDGQTNVTVAGNCTLPALPVGLHTLTVYANDTAGNFGASENVAFNIVVKPEPFPITLALTASGVSVAIAIVGITLFFKKRKH